MLGTRLKSWVSALMLFALCSGSMTVFAANMTVQEVKFWQGILGRNPYDNALIELVLDITMPEYGPYNLEIVTQSFGAYRAEREIELGEIVNVSLSPLRPEHYLESKKLIPIMQPAMRGLLGYRSLIVDKYNTSKFESVSTLDDLRQIKLGQARGWLDVDVYESNGVPVVEATVYDYLYSMLDRKRFDALPLGIGELDHSLAEFSDKYPDLVKYNRLVIYYPFPVTFQVSANHPVLAKRIERGMILAKETGRLDALFEQHYADVLEEYRNGDVTVISLKNPIFPDEEAFKSLGLSEPQLIAP